MLYSTRVMRHRDISLGNSPKTCLYNFSLVPLTKIRFFSLRWRNTALMRRKRIVAEKAFVNNTFVGFFSLLPKRSLENATKRKGETRVFQKGLVCCQIQKRHTRIQPYKVEETKKENTKTIKCILGILQSL